MLDRSSRWMKRMNITVILFIFFATWWFKIIYNCKIIQYEYEIESKQTLPLVNDWESKILESWVECVTSWTLIYRPLVTQIVYFIQCFLFSCNKLFRCQTNFRNSPECSSSLMKTEAPQWPPIAYLKSSLLLSSRGFIAVLSSWWAMHCTQRWVGRGAQQGQMFLPLCHGPLFKSSYSARPPGSV